MSGSFPKTPRIISTTQTTVLGTAVGATQNDVNLAADAELAVPLRLYASVTPDSKLNILSTQIQSADGGNKSVGPLNSTIPSFVASWIDFQSQTTSGGSISISFPASTVGMFRRCVFSLDINSNLIVTFSSEAASVGALPNAGSLFGSQDLPIGWVDLVATDASGLFKTANSSSNIIENANIYRIQAGGGGGGTVTGYAQEVSISNGVSSITITFPSPLAGSDYTVQAQLVNLIDADPQFQPMMVSNKTSTGFTAIWNAPTDSANYLLDYIVPSVQEQNGELDVGSGVTSVVVSLPISLLGTNYSVVAELADYTDASPQFQSVLITNKSDTNFTASWNAPTDSANYTLAYRVAQYQ